MSKNISKAIKQALVVFAITAIGLTLFSFAPEALAQGGFTDQPIAPDRVLGATQGEGSLRSLILTFLNFFLGFLGLIAVIMIIYGGILYVTSGGDSESVDKGKKILMYAVAGIVIILLSFALVNTILGGIGQGTDT